MPGLQERRTSTACTSFRIASDLKDFAPRRFDPLFHFGPITRRKIRLGKALPDTEPIGKRKRRAKKTTLTAVLTAPDCPAQPS